PPGGTERAGGAGVAAAGRGGGGRGEAGGIGGGVARADGEFVEGRAEWETTGAGERATGRRGVEFGGGVARGGRSHGDAAGAEGVARGGVAAVDAEAGVAARDQGGRRGA